MMVKTRDVVNIAVAGVFSFSLILHTNVTLRQSAMNGTNPAKLNLSIMSGNHTEAEGE